MEKQTIQKRDIDRGRAERQPHGQQIIQNALEYADDTQLFIENDTHEQMSERIGNYDIITETRHLTIQWDKVHLIRRERRKLRMALPTFDEIQHQSTGTILGKEISMTGSQTKAVTLRIAKAHHTWKQVRYKLLRNKAITPRIKLIMWNSLIGSTMIYGLHTTEMPISQTKRIETFMYKHIRTMMNPGWKDEQWYPEKKQLYMEIRQPTLKSWVEKTQVMTMLTQTRGKTIHPKQCAEMILPRQNYKNNGKETY